MPTVNKLKNIWVSNDTTNLDGSYSTKVSILNAGRTELNDTIINSKLAINKNIDSSKDYQIDVSGNINFTGNLYQNNALFSSGISQAFADDKYQTLTGMSLYQLISNNTAYVKNDANINSFLLGSGSNNITLGTGQGVNNFSGGALALNGLTTGNFNCAIGAGALQFVTTGSENFGMGTNALHFLTTGSFNVVIGVNSGTNISSGISNVLIGRYVGGGIYTSFDNTAIGYFSLLSGSGNSNCCVGAYSGQTLTTGSNNCLIGSYAYGITTGSNNTFIGNSTTALSGAFNNSTCVGYGSSISGSNRIILGRSTEVTYAMGGLNIPGSTVLELLGNISANSLTVTPAQLSFLNQVTSNKIPASVISDINNYQLVSGMSSYLSSTITQNLTANNKTITPGQLGFLNLVSNQQLPTSAIKDYGVGFLTSTISSNLTANALTITPAQLSFLNKVLVSPSLNAGLIPQSAIGNVADFVKNNANTIITATYTFNTNPIFQLSAIPLGAIADISINYMDLFNSQTIAGIKTFTSSPVFSGEQITADSIPVTAINSFDLTQYINALIPSSINTANFVDISNDQTINGIKTFSSAPVMSGASITAGTVPLTSIANLQANYFKKGLDQTVNSIFTFNSNPVFNAGAIPTTAISGYGEGYLTTSLASTTYQPQSSMSSYLTTATASATYLTTALASTTYQTITGMSSYLTTATANSTYQTITGMANYLTTSNATSTYQPISAMSNYLTTSTNALSGISSINSTGTTVLDIGNSSTTTRLNGSVIVSNNTQKVNGFSTLSGTSTLSTPLSEYYILSQNVAGTVNLPVITADMYGSQITFMKVNATNTYTINTGTGNTFRLLGSSSSATQTSIAMSSNFTVLKLVATQSTVWDVVVSNNMEKVNTSLITATTTTAVSFPFYKYYSIATPNTTAITITIPTASSDLLGQKILFRRVNTQMAQINCSSINGLTNVSTTVLLSTAQYNCEIVCLANSATPTYAWYIIRQN